MKFLLGMQVPPTISEKTASPFIACGRIIKKVEHKQGQTPARAITRASKSSSMTTMMTTSTTATTTTTTTP